MKKLILILLLLPITMYCQNDFPEWEKIEINMDSLELRGQIQTNSKNELFILLQTGIFKSTNEGDSWSRLNMPDSLIYGNNLLKMNGPTIYTYAVVYNEEKWMNKYMVYSNDFGENWIVIPEKEIKFPGFEKSDFMFIDEKGEIWGISSNRDIDKESKLVVNKFDVLNITTTKMFDIPYTYYKILIQDSLTILMDIGTVTDSFGTYKSWKAIDVFYTLNNGITWDTILFNDINNGKNINIAYNHYNSYDFMIESKGILYTRAFAYYPAEIYDKLIQINLVNKKFEILDEKLNSTTKFKKVSDSAFYMSKYYNNMHWKHSIFKSKDMINWEILASPIKLDDIPDSVKYIHCDFYSEGYWDIDNNENHYLYNDTSLIKISEKEKSWQYVNRTGLINVNIGQIEIDSKSNIILVDNQNYKNIIVLNPNNNVKKIIHQEFKIGEYLFKCFLNDSFIFDKWDQENRIYSSIIYDNNNFSEYYQTNINDTTKIHTLSNTESIGKKYIALTVSGIKNQFTYGFAYSEDYCQTWKILKDIKTQDRMYDYTLILNTFSHIIRVENYSRFYISKDFGKNWELLFDDSSNTLFNKHYNYKVDLINYNEANGTGIVKYQSEGPIYYTLDHGYTWSEIDSNTQAFNFIHEIDQYTISDNLRNLPVSYDENYTFYLSTLHGIYRSTDTLKSFHNISKGIIEPSYIYDFQAGNDGRLYAVNYNGIWRTKEKVVNSVVCESVISGDMRLKVYPNPAGDYIEISIPELNKGLQPLVQKVQIFDVLGIEVLSELIHPMTSSYRMNVESLTAGVYYIKIGDKVEKFVKM